MKAKGFVVMDTPGYDPVSMTGIVAGGANVQATIGFDNGTPLITAAQLGFVDIVRALTEAKADVDHVNTRGWTALMLL